MRILGSRSFSIFFAWTVSTRMERFFFELILPIFFSDGLGKGCAKRKDSSAVLAEQSGVGSLFHEVYELSCSKRGKMVENTYVHSAVQGIEGGQKLPLFRSQVVMNIFHGTPRKCDLNNSTRPGICKGSVD